MPLSKEEIKTKILVKKGVLNMPNVSDVEVIKKDKKTSKMTFIVHSTYGEIVDLAERLKDEGHEVLVHIPDNGYKKIGDGIVEKTSEWYRCIGEGYIWVFDGCEHGDLQDWLRSKGEMVFGGNKIADELENERQLNQKWFKEAGFDQPFSKNFQSIDEALAFVEEHSDKRWILKQNGDAPKSINHMGKFEGNEDMLFHLKELKKGWNEQEYGKFDCDLMEVVTGMEVAASAFFNGHDFLRNSEGQVVGFLNWEEKKEADGGLGETTGETGTLFLGCTDENELFKEIMLKPKIISKLQQINFRGVFDINCIKTDDGLLVGLEPTCRFGVPSTAYEFLEGMITPCAEVIKYCAEGLDEPIKIHEGFGQVLVITSKPYPVEADLEDEATSLGEKLWIMDGDGETLLGDFTPEQKKHIHLYNFEKTTDPETEEVCYKVVTKSGYLLTVTGRDLENKEDGENDIEIIRKNLKEYVKNNIYISGIKYRQDIGKRVEKYL